MRGQDELPDLVSETLVARGLPADEPGPAQWEQWLRRLDALPRGLPVREPAAGCPGRTLRG